MPAVAAEDQDIVGWIDFIVEDDDHHKAKIAPALTRTTNNRRTRHAIKQRC